MDLSRGVPDGTESESSTVGNASTTGVNTNQVASIAWNPNDTFLISLTSMGISPVTAKKALYYTQNVSAEAAIDWIFENQQADLETPLEIELQRNNPTSTNTQFSSVISSDESDDLFKMVFVVNAELSMGVGKIAAQVAHAALGLHRLLLQHQSKYGETLLNWTEYGETKIVLKGNSTEHLIDLEHQSISLGLPCYQVHDAGKTQVRSGSTTVLAIFGSNNQVDKVTGTLKLY